MFWTRDTLSPKCYCYAIEDPEDAIDVPLEDIIDVPQGEVIDVPQGEVIDIPQGEVIVKAMVHAKENDLVRWRVNWRATIHAHNDDLPGAMESELVSPIAPRRTIPKR